MSPPPFETMLPEIETRSRRHYAHVRGGAQDDLVAESVALAFGLYDSAVARGNYRFTPCTLAWYANKAVDEGRRFAGGWVKKDAANHRTVGFDALDADGRNIIGEALINRQTSTFDQARIRIDWPMFLDELPERSAWLVEEIASGTLRSEAALALGLSPGRVTQIMGEVADAYVERFGTPGFEHKSRRGKKHTRGRPSKRKAA